MCADSQVFVLQRLVTLIRDEVEDTTFEAKDSKKIRGQGRSFGGQTFWRPRTGMVEAKSEGIIFLNYSRQIFPNEILHFIKFLMIIGKQ